MGMGVDKSLYKTKQPPSGERWNTHPRAMYTLHQGRANQAYNKGMDCQSSRSIQKRFIELAKVLELLRMNS